MLLQRLSTPPTRTASTNPCRIQRAADWLDLLTGVPEPVRSAGRVVLREVGGMFSGHLTTWAFDGAGRLLEERQTYDSGSLAQKINSYDANGNQLEEKRLFNGKLSRRISWTHGPDGPLTHYWIA